METQEVKQDKFKVSQILQMLSMDPTVESNVFKLVPENKMDEYELNLDEEKRSRPYQAKYVTFHKTEYKKFQEAGK